MFKRQPTVTGKIAFRASTQILTSITLPRWELKLGENVIAPTGIISFPEELNQLKNPRCLELVRKFETRQDSLSGSGAENWGDLDDRMSFVVDFFGSHQQYIRMWERPFLPDQAAVIESGHIPGEPL
jgi:hypothetical protein